MMTRIITKGHVLLSLSYLRKPKYFFEMRTFKNKKQKTLKCFAESNSHTSQKEQVSHQGKSLTKTRTMSRMLHQEGRGVIIRLFNQDVYRFSRGHRAGKWQTLGSDPVVFNPKHDVLSRGPMFPKRVACIHSFRSLP